MLTRLLKLLSGLIPLWGRGAAPAPGGVRERDIGELCDACSQRMDREPPPSGRIGDSPHPPTRAGYSSDLDFIIDRHAWQWPGSSRIDGARGELGRLRAGGPRLRTRDPVGDLDFIIDRHDAAEWCGDPAAASAELDGLRAADAVGRARADYRVCDKCSAFLTAGESGSLTCPRCTDAMMILRATRSWCAARRA